MRAVVLVGAAALAAHAVNAPAQAPATRASVVCCAAPAGPLSRAWLSASRVRSVSMPFTSTPTEVVLLRS